MKSLYIDALAGISGDMMLGALVDLGVDFDALRDALRSLDVKGFDIKQTATKRHEIAATKIDVIVEDVPHPHRHLGDLEKIIRQSDLSQDVQENSFKILQKLAEAEAKVHRMPLEKVHLHEVGGLDCLVDVVGTVWGLDSLSVDSILAGPVSVGSGFVKCAHGVMPLPAPGTLAILEGFPVRRTQIPHELTTPTGAAIIATIAEPVLESIVFKTLKVGYGAGSRDNKEAANLLRLMLIETTSRQPKHEHHHHDHDHSHDHNHHHHQQPAPLETLSS